LTNNQNLNTATAVNPINVTSVPGDVSTDQSNRTYLTMPNLPAPAQQSPTYAALQKRLEAFDNSHPVSDEEANREFRELLRQRQALKNGEKPGANPDLGTNPDLTGGGPGPGAGTTGGTPAGPVAPPVQVTSIATGISSRELANLLNQAEELTQKQQYGKAMEVYTQAYEAAPNNPLILIGRANAEIGGSYYRQAESDLRLAFSQDKAMLMGQYDLQKVLGDERLQYVIAQLKQIATDSKDNPTPLFLLAYISYNTHNESKAKDYLTDAAARNPNGVNDPVIPMLEKYWTFTDSAPATQPSGLNK
jgi:tetratricopeptide (TPR) repeat protein